MICLTFNSCKKFNWEAKTYGADSATQAIYNENGEAVACSEPAFDDYLCFPSENIADLIAEIDRINKKNKKKVSKILKSLEKPELIDSLK